MLSKIAGLQEKEKKKNNHKTFVSTCGAAEVLRKKFHQYKHCLEKPLSGQTWSVLTEQCVEFNRVGVYSSCCIVHDPSIAKEFTF